MIQGALVVFGSHRKTSYLAIQAWIGNEGVWMDRGSESVPEHIVW